MGDSGAAIERTHGRWPWLAAASAAPATAVVFANRERLGEDGSLAVWIALPALLWHQTEEWVWPGGFLPWFNRTQLGSDADEFPITRRDGLMINAGLGWALSAAAALRGMRNPTLGATVHGLLLGNVIVHARAQLGAQGYTPGIVTALGLLWPTATAGLIAIARHPRGGLRAAAAGKSIGLAASAISFAAMRSRARRPPSGS